MSTCANAANLKDGKRKFMQYSVKSVGSCPCQSLVKSFNSNGSQFANGIGSHAIFFHSEDDLYSQLNPQLECKAQAGYFFNDLFDCLSYFRADDFTKVIGLGLNAD